MLILCDIRTKIIIQIFLLTSIHSRDCNTCYRNRVHVIDCCTIINSLNFEKVTYHLFWFNDIGSSVKSL